LNETKLITAKLFKERLVDLCLRSGITGLPKREEDRHIVFKSAALYLEPTTNLTESELNEGLQAWLNDVWEAGGLDHVTLRRWLVDTGYLTRDRDGASYRIAPSTAAPYAFEEEIKQLHLPEVLEAAKKELEERKRRYMDKSKKDKGGGP
jgi:hypothetical protein